jgi:hypothetical protein
MSNQDKDFNKSFMDKHRQQRSRISHSTLVQLKLLDLCYPYFQATLIHVFKGFENKDKRLAIS